MTRAKHKRCKHCGGECWMHLDDREGADRLVWRCQDCHRDRYERTLRRAPGVIR